MHGSDVSVKRRVALFRNGRSQALRIPRAFELPGNQAFIHREGEVLVVEPVAKGKGLLALLAELEPLAEEFPDIDRGLPPADDIRL